MAAEGSRQEIGILDLSLMNGYPVANGVELPRRFQATGKTIGNTAEDRLRAATKQVAQHRTTADMGRISAGEKFLPYVSHVWPDRTVASENLCLQRPHYPGIPSKNESDVVLRRLGWRRLPGRVLVGAVLYVPRFITGQVPADAGLQYLGDGPLQLIVGLRDVEGPDDVREQVVVPCPHDFQHLVECVSSPTSGQVDIRDLAIGPCQIERSPSTSAKGPLPSHARSVPNARCMISPLTSSASRKATDRLQ